MFLNNIIIIAYKGENPMTLPCTVCLNALCCWGHFESLYIEVQHAAQIEASCSRFLFPINALLMCVKMIVSHDACLLRATTHFF